MRNLWPQGPQETLRIRSSPQNMASFWKTEKTPLRFIQARSSFHWRVQPGILREGVVFHREFKAKKKTSCCRFGDHGYHGPSQTYIFRRFCMVNNLVFLGGLKPLFFHGFLGGSWVWKNDHGHQMAVKLHIESPDGTSRTSDAAEWLTFMVPVK